MIGREGKPVSAGIVIDAYSIMWYKYIVSRDAELVSSTALGKYISSFASVFVVGAAIYTEAV